MLAVGSRHFWRSNVPRTKLVEVPSPILRALLGAASLLALTPGCDGCGTQKPYTPFGVASALPTPPAPSAGEGSIPAESALADAGVSGFAVRKAELVPGAPGAWQGPGLSLNAPEGRRFALVLPADFDGDGQPDAMAWLVPGAEAENASPGELWFFPGSAAARKLADLPSFVPSSADCTLVTSLNQTGERSATLDAAATCTTQFIARTATRALLVVAPNVERPVLLLLRASLPAPEESFELSVDSTDQDHDGRDDVRLTMSLRGASTGEPASAEMIWLDRAAGASRSANEPATSLFRLASKLAARARLKRGASSVIERVGATRRLLSSLCAEGGVPRLFDEDGVPFRCGNLSRVVDSLAATEAQAALTEGDVLTAFSVLNRDGWYFGKSSSPQRKAIERDLRKAVGKFELGTPLIAHAQPAVPKLPHYSPLWFESDGALLIRGATVTTRISADRTSEEAVSAEAGVPSWPLDLALESGERVLGGVHACDRSELLLTESDAQHPILPPIPTRLLAARPASCTGRGAGPSVSIAPIRFDENGLEALINGARVLTSSNGKKLELGLPRMGTPLSPDGRWLVAPSSLGLLLIGDRNEVWQLGKGDEHADASRFSDCVVANDARAVACIDGGRAVLFERPRPSASTPPKK